MENGTIGNEMRKGISLCMIVSSTFLSLIIIILNRVLDWEVWMIPVVIAGCAGCWVIMFSNRVSQRLQIYLFGVFLVFLEFYYCIRIQTVYDSAAVIVLIIFLFAFTREKPLIIFGAASAYLGLIFHLIIVHESSGLKTGLSSVVRTIMVFLMVPLSVTLVEYILKIWNNSERSYQERIDVLSKENERANNFLANVSHEIRTPVSAVIGLSHVLQKSDLAQQDRDKVRAISEAGYRVSEQISDILDFTEVEMKKMAVNEESYMMTTLFSGLLTQLSQTDDYGLDFVIDIEPKLPSVLVGDESKIRRVLWHLIMNSYKFTKEGGVYVRVYSVKRDYGINLVIEVKDTGLGMTQDEIDNSYEKFYQADSGRARSKGGLGLGIPIVGGFVKSMGGVFTMESTVGEGTCVRVSIPQAVEDASPSITVEDSSNCVVAGFLGFMTTGHPKIREYYLEMITNLSAGLSIPMHRVQSGEELEKLTESENITHLFVGTGEYMENRELIDSLTGRMNVALVADRGFDGEVGEGITILPKPFYGTQVANFLNQNFAAKQADAELVITFPGIRALVVDDEQMNLIVAREIFGGYGMVISTASGGEESIEMCSENEYDIVFMDHMMPGMDGVEAMHRIKQNAARNNKEICVVALTANAISSAKEMFLSEGFDGFIPKPIEISEMERVLKRVLPKSSIVYSSEPRKKRRKKKTDVTVTADTVRELADAVNTAAETRIHGETESDPMIALKEAGLDTDHGLDYCGGDREFYEELLTDYARNREIKLKELDGFFEEKDWENYEIRVHSIKSTSAMIGASSVSEQAKELEFAAKGGDTGFIESSHDAFRKDYAELLDSIAGYYASPSGGGAA